MAKRYLEDFTVGQTFGSGRLRVDTEQIKAFAAEKRTLNSLMGKLRASLQVGMEQNTLGSVANLIVAEKAQSKRSGRR